MLGYDVEIFEANGEKTISTSYPNIYILLTERESLAILHKIILCFLIAAGKSDSNSRFPLSILFIFRLAAALPHLPHAAMTSMAWNRCISSYRIIPVSSFVLNFHALTRTKLKLMAEAISPFGGGSVNEWVYNKNYYGLWAGSQSSTIVTGACAPI